MRVPGTAGELSWLPLLFDDLSDFLLHGRPLNDEGQVDHGNETHEEVGCSSQLGVCKSLKDGVVAVIFSSGGFAEEVILDCLKELNIAGLEEAKIDESDDSKNDVVRENHEYLPFSYS